MVLMTFTVPCYNSESYMHKCIDSLLPAGDDTEIIIIDDGSTDGTGAIADEYAAAHPDRVRVVHQENGGHGEGVNQGIRLAQGKYFKVVDSDDWLDTSALHRLMDRMREHEAAGVDVDMYAANYVYEHVSDGKTFVMNYRRIFPHETVCSWEEIRPFGITQYLMMHSVYFKTAILRDCGLELPKHTFYVDNLFMFKPLPAVHTIYYMPLDLYRYFIGRSDQSVTLENGAKRVDQQIRVTKMMVDCFDLRAMGKTRPKLRRYLLHELGMMVLICAVFSYADDTPERRKNFYDVWKYIKEKDRWLYRRLRWSSTAMVATGKSKFSRWIDVCGYRFFRRIVKFG